MVGAKVAHSRDRDGRDNMFSRFRIGRAVGAVLCVMGGLAVSAAPASASASVYRYQAIVPVSGGQSGCTEFIQYSGTALTRFRAVTDAAGGMHIDDFFAALQGVSGVGETSGATYRVVGVQGAAVTNNLISNNGVNEVTGVTHYKFVGPGPENNQTVDIYFHVTFVDGEIKTTSFSYSVSCANG
jgi:hypothetical protein